MSGLREYMAQEERITGGHRACTGCLPMVSLKQALMNIKDPVVVGIATGCMEVVSTIYPYTAWNVPLIHNAFENAAATVSGVEAAYNALRRKGKIAKKIKLVAFGGDGGTYDIGLQSLSGAMERGHNMLYICYNNEGYMNTGIQRSSATTMGAWTSTSPDGAVKLGKQQLQKNLTEIMIAHDLPYAAQADIGHWKDYMKKVEKAAAIDGPTFINVLSPCTLGWKFPAEDGMSIAQMAAETCIWPLYEAEHGYRKLTYKPREKKPVREWLKMQGRFRHLFRTEHEPMIEELQRQVDRRWDLLLRLCGETP
ncbi:MAG: pyruvate ferredoxin oxidoreductase [Acidobacteria bacterium]|nr:pyruvate ferredoxin oxidoreductase [Acidobacteriota bacterium]MBI3658242.1 pyruvate ferredoxin oxidoreductase [Acidobacteriota bacterium]